MGEVPSFVFVRPVSSYILPGLTRSAIPLTCRYSSRFLGYRLVTLVQNMVDNPKH